METNDPSKMNEPMETKTKAVPVVKERKFPCTLCNKRFTFSGNLDTHMVKKHNMGKAEWKEYKFLTRTAQKFSEHVQHKWEDSTKPQGKIIKKPREKIIKELQDKIIKELQGDIVKKPLQKIDKKVNQMSTKKVGQKPKWKVSEKISKMPLMKPMWIQQNQNILRTYGNIVRFCGPECMKNQKNFKTENGQINYVAPMCSKCLPLNGIIV